MENYDKIKEKGLYGKYIIQKANREPIDPKAKYFVLRYDEGGSDPQHIEACRRALRTYAYEILHHLPILSKDLFDILEGFKDEI